MASFTSSTRSSFRLCNRCKNLILAVGRFACAACLPCSEDASKYSFLRTPRGRLNFRNLCPSSNVPAAFSLDRRRAVSQAQSHRHGSLHLARFFLIFFSLNFKV